MKKIQRPTNYPRLNFMINMLPKLHFQRFEFKYHLSSQDAEKISSDLLNNMVWDPHVLDCPDKSYTVTSLYLDSPALKCYHEKISGLKDRFKLRLRIYKDFLETGDDVFLEIKRKSDMVISKDRVILPFEIYKKILCGNSCLFSCASKHQQKTLQEFIWKKHRYCMKPLIYVRYKRKPLIGRFNDKFRVTFDSNISASCADDLSSCEKIHNVASGVTVMEVKYNNTLPSWFLHVIHKYQLDRRPFSKYCSGIEVSKKNNLF